MISKGLLFFIHPVDLLKSESCDYTCRFLEQMFTSSFFPLILRPTRITQHTATLIDNIFTNDIENIEDSTKGILFWDISDHLPIVHVRNLKTPHETPPAKEFIYKRVTRDSNVKSFSNTIKNMSWENVLSSNNSTESYNQFFHLSSPIYESNFPLTKNLTNEKLTKRKVHR